MHNVKIRKLRYRPLLTETLPYEVPVIFSNDLFFSSLVGEIHSAAVRNEHNKILQLGETATRPYAYSIRKDGSGLTDLGIIHPLSQLKVSSFYDQYAQTILECCNRSEFSLRRPARIAPTQWRGPLKSQATQKLGIPHVTKEDGEIDVSRIASYFSYSRYNLLFKFYDSQELLRLEKKFSRMRSLDVSKCFFNIYTHSVSWAIKGRDFSKAHRKAYSFESEFDRLMQCCNDSETNGIVVGPEVSRIFAEHILQDVDIRVQKALLESPHFPLVHGRDYAVRRYVDDFLIFAANPQILDRIENAARLELRNYKLFINEKKVDTFSRPFVSKISLARREITQALSEVAPLVARVKNASPHEISEIVAKFKKAVWDIRLIVAKYGVGFHTISGWLLTRLKSVLRQMTLAVGPTTEPHVRVALLDSILRMMQLVFYVCALDIRVRTSYSLCQIAATLKKFSRHCSTSESDQVNQVFSDELASLCQNVAASLSEDKGESIELYNLLICGAFFAGEEFVRQPDVVRALKIIKQRPLRYFSYITCKFCYLKVADRKAFVRRLNDAVKKKILAAPNEVGRDSELFLFFCEYVGAADVGLADKRQVLQAVVGGNPSNATVAALSSYLGFSDMDGLRIEHSLKRKELRPAYAW